MRGQDQPAKGITEAVDVLVRPILEAEGFDLVLVEYVPSGSILRLYIDQLEEGRGVSIDDCATVSHLVSDLLDAEGLSDQIDGTYNLEVSSPGLDRPLVRPGDFSRFVEREVRVQTRAPRDGRRKFKGKLVEADVAAEGGIVLEVDGQSCSIGYAAIQRARLVPDL